LKVKAVKTKFWRPNEDFLKIIVESVQSFLRNGDIVVISEKAISTSLGNIVDESKVVPGFLAKFLVIIWMRLFWGFFLGNICRFKESSINHFRFYPLKEGSSHKQVVLRCSGFLSALKYGSEGGIDISNMPSSLACLPLEKPQILARQIYEKLKKKTGKNLTVIISDTDSTFSFHNIHFTSHPHPIKGIINFGGVLPFILGRALNVRQRATPLAVEGVKVEVEEAILFAEIAHHIRGSGAGRTVWDMSKRYNVNFSEITWNMLDLVKHFPIVLLRR
jgi:F420-0:gamma-glutamyl ligase-like protein